MLVKKKKKKKKKIGTQRISGCTEWKIVIAYISFPCYTTVFKNPPKSIRIIFGDVLSSGKL